MRFGRKARRNTLAAVIMAAAVLGALAWYFRPDRVIRAGTGTVAETLCTQVFISHFAAKSAFRETLEPSPGLRHLHWTVDFRTRQVRSTWLGLFASTAVYRGPAGCLLWRSLLPAPPAPELAPFPPALQPPIAGAEIVRPFDPRLTAALDHIFAEPAKGPPRLVKAVVVLKDGQVVAERYATGIGPDTPLLGYSVSKLVINALAGILAGRGKLRLDTPAAIQAWATPGDPRHAITLANLLRMTSGLAIPEAESGYDAVSRMLFTEPDMAGFAAQAPLLHPPGTVWDYSSGNTLLAARIIANAAGGTETSVLDFARSALFGPLGMTTAVIETDAVGTPVGSTFILASARDWARLGLLYLDDGVAGGQRVLPPGWVSYTRTATPGPEYGAGVFTNDGPGEGALGRLRAGMPRDAFFASGRLGQRIYIMPTQRLVVVRFGITQMPDFDIAGDLQLLREVVAALSLR